MRTGSSPVAGTTKKGTHLGAFLCGLRNRTRTHLNGTVRWTVPRRRLDDADTIVKSSPVARTITDTVIDTIVSVAVSVFMPFLRKTGYFSKLYNAFVAVDSTMLRFWDIPEVIEPYILCFLSQYCLISFASAPFQKNKQPHTVVKRLLCIKAAPHNGTRRFGEGFWTSRKF